MNFTNKTAVVTGATRGIGKSIASFLVEHGCQTIVTGTAATPPVDFQGGSRVYHSLNLENDASISAFVGFLESLPKIDILINNAGINKIEPIDTLSLDTWNKILKVNLTGPMQLIGAVVPKMKAAGRGRIVNISSIWSTRSKEKRHAYSASKSGINGLTRSTAIELAPYNILVNAVCPGFTNTELTDSMLSDQEQQALATQVPLKRFAATEEIAPLVAFLSSDLNTYITGQSITIDGGYTIT